VKSLLKKRLSGILAVGIVAFAVGAAGATATAPAPEASAVAGVSSGGATVSFLLPAQQRARARETRACRKIRNARKRKACLKRVATKYRRIAAAQAGQTRVIDVGDNYYAPDQLTIKRFDQLRWDWQDSFSPEGHNVSLLQGPKGVSPYDFESPIRVGPDYKFTRRFLTPGDYKLFCTLHVGMEMDVRVTK
jgi:plastocyanin